MSSSPTPPYTEATRRLVADALVERGGVAWTYAMQDAAVALDALFHAGLLLPEGAETRTEWGTRITWDDGTVEDMPCLSEEFARRRVAMHAEKRANRPGWRATAELISRQVRTEPWALVDAEGGGEADQSNGVDHA